MPKKVSLLEIKPKEMRSNLIALFERLGKDKRAHDAFLSDPTGAISRSIMKRTLPPQRTSEANRLLFSLLANDAMVAWLRDYGGDLADKKQFALDFAKEVQALDDKNIIAALISHVVSGSGIPGLTDVAYQCVCNETPNKYDCACTPVAKDQVAPEMRIRPELVRAIAEDLIKRAKDLSKQGALVNLGCQVR